MKKLLKDTRGFSHHLLVPAIVIVLVVGIGTYLLLKSRAADVRPGLALYHFDSCIDGNSCATPVITHDAANGSQNVGNFDVGPDSYWHATASEPTANGFTDSKFAWAGPNRPMTIPSGASGVEACYRYGMGSPTSGQSVVAYFDIASAGKVLASAQKTLHYTQIGDALTPTEAFCLQYAAASGTVLNNVEERVQLKYTADKNVGVDIIRTSLSYY